MRKILFCGNGMSGEVIPLLSNEYEIAVITEFPHDFGLAQASVVFEANSKDSVAALEAAKKIWREGFKFEAVLSLCWDCPESVSAIAKFFNLKGLPIEVAEISSDKYLRSQKFLQNNILSPKFFKVDTLNELMMLKEDISYPIVLKPLNLSSSKGVIKVESEEKLIESFEYAKSYAITSSKKSILVNEFIDGQEFSVEGLMINSVLYLTGISERIFEYHKYSPYFVEVGDIIPADIDKSTEIQLQKLVNDAATALGISEGVVKADIIQSKLGELYVLEITPRLGGPRFGTEMIPLSNGTNILKAYIQQLLNEEVDMKLLTPQYKNCVINRSIFLEEGVISEVTFDSTFDQVGFYDFKWWGITPIETGSEVTRPKYGCGNVGYIISYGKTREEAIANTDRIESTIKFKFLGAEDER
ncbi:ATP-grasp domain-containing protein [Streptococcus ruminantium]|uniref:ATP-grasp domain-containing protein n=1 Tax=Streptococcus ruminantium TaxID=1917441 RepID=UPI0012DBD6CE|nr:ATP-grasp domain-containing protein [Streptococcus ruminantium]